MIVCDFDSCYYIVTSLDDLEDSGSDMTVDNIVVSPSQPAIQALTAENVPLRSGPPTREELLVHYPARFTWDQLKTFVNSGDLGMLKRDKKLQIRYMAWSKEIKEEYGSMVNYLLDHRLQWGKPDALSIIPSRLDPPGLRGSPGSEPTSSSSLAKDRKPNLPPIPTDAPAYFKADIPPELVSVIMNDWPYSVPPEIEHSLIWTRLPMTPTDLPPSLAPRIAQDGLWGFTGNDSPPPSPSLLPACLPALAEWGVTMDNLIRSPKGTPEEEERVKRAGDEISTFVKRRWNEDEWETAWFVNPPRLQSIPGLAHAHVFAKYKGKDN